MSAKTHAGRLFVQCPRGGAWLMNLMGGCGNFAIALILPFMDSRLDQAGPGAAMQSVSAPAIILVAIFGSLLLYFRARGGYAPVTLSTARTGGYVEMFERDWQRCGSGSGGGDRETRDDNTPIWTHMGHSWKIDYHSIRSMIQSINRLEKLPVM